MSYSVSDILIATGIQLVIIGLFIFYLYKKDKKDKILLDRTFGELERQGVIPL